MPRALVTGVAGQDGWYLAKLLLSKGYEVVGCGRPGSLLGPRGAPLRELGVKLVEMDLLDRYQTLRGVAEVAPDEIYNMAGHSFVPQSWEDPATAIRITSWPVIHLMDAVHEVAPRARFYQSSTSEIFGLTPVTPQDEATPVAPANPYAAAKVFAHQFVTAKVCHAARAIAAGKERELWLGDLDVIRDWGFAGDYADAMWRMLQQERAADFIIGTGVPHTVRELCELAFRRVGLDYREYVRQDPAFMRPGQPTRLVANPAKARRELGWQATTGFDALVAMMVDGVAG